MKKIFLFICSLSLSAYAMEKSEFNEKKLINDLQAKTLITLASLATDESDIPHLGTMAAYDFIKKISNNNHRICAQSKEGLIKIALLNEDGTIPDSLQEVMFPILNAKKSEKNTEESWKIEELVPKFPAFEEENKESGTLDLANIPISQLKLVED